jgi:hypothetical protein
MEGVCSKHDRGEKCIQNFVGNPEGKSLLEICKRRWENDVRMNFIGLRWKGVQWIHLALCRAKWGALVNMVMNLSVPLKVSNSSTS